MKTKTIEDYEAEILETYEAIIDYSKHRQCLEANKLIAKLHNLYCDRNKLLMKEFRKGRKVGYPRHRK